MNWLDLTMPEVAALPPDTVAVLPLGAVEQHGPHLPVSTDLVAAVAAAEAAVAAVVASGDVPVVLLPGLAFTKSDEHARFPGTIWLSWDTLMRTLVDVGRSLAASGITRLLFVNGHGGNSALGQVACREIRRESGLRTFFAHLSVPVDQGGTSSAGNEYGMGIHGGHGETSLMREFSTIGFGKPVSFGWTSDDFGPDGHIGDPTGATAEHGKAVFEAAVTHLTAVIGEAHRFSPR